MSRVMRPLLALLLVFVVGIGVIYLDQTHKLPSIGSPSSPTPTTPSNPNDPYNNLGKP